MTISHPSTLHVLLDAARMGTNMTPARVMNQQHTSLYKGDSAKDLADFAPYIFSLTDNDKFTRWLLDTGWGNSWGVFLQTAVSGRDLIRHFRQFLMITLDTGEEAYFRFYDPRVLRIFLPTCNPKQLREFFGPIQQFLVEDEDPEYALYFWLKAGVLHHQRVSRTVINSCFFTPSNT